MYTHKNRIFQVQVGLKFLANGGTYQDIGEMFGISKSSVQRIVEEFTTFVGTQYNTYVKFPTTGYVSNIPL